MAKDVRLVESSWAWNARRNPEFWNKFMQRPEATEPLTVDFSTEHMEVTGAGPSCDALQAEVRECGGGAVNLSLMDIEGGATQQAGQARKEAEKALTGAFLGSIRGTS